MAVMVPWGRSSVGGVREALVLENADNRYVTAPESAAGRRRSADAGLNLDAPAGPKKLLRFQIKAAQFKAASSFDVKTKQIPPPPRYPAEPLSQPPPSSSGGQFHYRPALPPPPPPHSPTCPLPRSRSFPHLWITRIPGGGTTAPTAESICEWTQTHGAMEALPGGSRSPSSRRRSRTTLTHLRLCRIDWAEISIGSVTRANGATKDGRRETSAAPTEGFPFAPRHARSARVNISSTNLNPEPVNLPLGGREEGTCLLAGQRAFILVLVLDQNLPRPTASHKRAARGFGGGGHRSPLTSANLIGTPAAATRKTR